MGFGLFGNTLGNCRCNVLQANEKVKKGLLSFVSARKGYSPVGGNVCAADKMVPASGEKAGVAGHPEGYFPVSTVCHLPSVV